MAKAERILFTKAGVKITLTMKEARALLDELETRPFSCDVLDDIETTLRSATQSAEEKEKFGEEVD